MSIAQLKNHPRPLESVQTVESTLSGPAHNDYYRLRTEWLRYKSQLYDGLTGLPALPAVMEDVRRVVESKGAADVVYVDLGRSGGQETKLGWAAYDGAVREFAAVLSSLYPVTTIVLAAILLRERVTRSHGAGILAAGVSIALIAAG